jgi:hypothetical protein
VWNRGSGSYGEDAFWLGEKVRRRSILLL